MSDEEDTLDDLLSKYVSLKKSGTKVDIKEAKKFYNEAFKAIHDKLKMTIALGSPQFLQDIPISKVKQADLEAIIDDCDIMQAQYVTFAKMLQLCYDLKTIPEQYNAWKGKVNNTLVYYVEKKEVEGNSELYV